MLKIGRRILAFKAATESFLLKKTMFGLIFLADVEEWRTHRKSALEEGKRASDFVGMVLRSAFCQYALLYAKERAPKQETLVASLSLSCCFVTFLALYIYLFLKCYEVVLLYWMQDTAYFKGVFVKLFFAISALLTAALFQYGQFLLVSELSKHAPPS